MPIPTVSPLPPAPSRASSPATFSTDADAHVAALTPWTTQVNAVATYLNGTFTTDMTALKDAAAASATAADVSEAAALGYANDASASATAADASEAQALVYQTGAQAAAAAAGAAAGLPSLTGNAFKSLTVNAAGDAVEWVATGLPFGGMVYFGAGGDTRNFNGQLYLKPSVWIPYAASLENLLPPSTSFRYGFQRSAQTPQVSGTNTNLSCVASGQGGRLVAGQTTNATDIFTSDDGGVTWTKRTTPSVRINAVATDGAGNWLAVGDSGGANGAAIYSTDNGNTWTANAGYVATSVQWTSVAFVNSVWMVGGQSGNLRTGTSVSAAPTTRTTGMASTIANINFSASTYCISGAAQLYTSTNLSAWTARTPTLTSATVLTLPAKLLAINTTGRSSSTDGGVTWSALDSSVIFGGVVSAVSGNHIYVAATSTNATNPSRRSTDGGNTWTDELESSAFSTNAICANGSNWVCVGIGGAVSTTPITDYSWTYGRYSDSAVPNLQNQALYVRFA